MDKPTKAQLLTIAKFLKYSFQDIDFRYAELTGTEKQLCTRAEFKELAIWVKSVLPKKIEEGDGMGKEVVDAIVLSAIKTYESPVDMGGLLRFLEGLVCVDDSTVKNSVTRLKRAGRIGHGKVSRGWRLLDHPDNRKILHLDTYRKSHAALG